MTTEQPTSCKPDPFNRSVTCEIDSGLSQHQSVNSVERPAIIPRQPAQAPSCDAHSLDPAYQPAIIPREPSQPLAGPNDPAFDPANPVEEFESIDPIDFADEEVRSLRGSIESLREPVESPPRPRVSEVNKDLLAKARAAGTQTAFGGESSESNPEAKRSEPKKTRGFGPILGRRKFLTVAGLATAGITLSTFPKVLGERAAAQTGARSLVCIFLGGGADSFNMFVPRDVRQEGHSHAVYSATRGSFAIPASSLLPIGDGSFGLNPALPGMAEIANQNKLAVVTNVGPLVRPTTKADFQARRSVPQSLFAHDAQQKLWQTGSSTLVSDQGWGGSVTAAVSEDVLAPSFSTNGSNVWSSGVGAKYSRISPTISVSLLDGYDPGTRDWIPRFTSLNEALMTNLELAKSSANPFDQVATESLESSILTTEALLAATSDSEANDVGMDDVAGTRLGAQLRLVAKLIKNRDQLEMPRQVFFVRLDGWDTHGEQAERFPQLLSELDNAASSFQRSMDGLEMADSVTAFTASDFGRTLTINGDGTDHGWGGHSFIMGGAVNPGQFGTLPNLTASASNPDDIGDRNSNFAGRIIPTTSVSQHGATLARWMGLSDAQIDDAFPELSNFKTRDLGFLN